TILRVQCSARGRCFRLPDNLLTFWLHPTEHLGPSLRRMFMRTMFTVILLATLAAAQQTTTLRPNAPDLTPATSSKLIIPSGTKVPLVLKLAISTKTAHDCDTIYEL